nr:MAG TPA: hypothetical protein [Caudoviricetes sp.]
MTELKRKYQKEYKRVKSLIRSFEKRGYVVPEAIKSIKPMSDTRVSTRSINRLKNITPEALYRKSRYITPEGKETSGVRGRDLEREAAGRKAAETRKKSKDKDLWIDLVWKNVVQPMIDRLKSGVPETYYSKRGLVPKADEVIKVQKKAAAELLSWLQNLDNRREIAESVYYAYKKGADLADALNTFLESGYLSDVMGSLEFLANNIGYTGNISSLSFSDGVNYEEEMFG